MRKEEPHSKSRVKAWFFGLVVLSFALALPVWWRLLHKDDWVTGAHKVTWYNEQGEILQGDPAEPYPRVGCDNHIDLHFGMLDFDGVLWTSCETKDTPQGGFAYIDPAKGEGHFFAVPPELPHEMTVGIVPGPEGSLGVIYSDDISAGHRNIFAGVLRRSGWVLPPRRLYNEEVRDFIGGAWVNGALELVAATSAERKEYTPLGQYDLLIERLEATEKPNMRLIKTAPICAAASLDCSGYPVLAQWREGSWRFTIETRDEEYSRNLYELDTEGKTQPRSFKRDPKNDIGSWNLRYLLDASVLGVMEFNAVTYQPYTDESPALGILQSDGSFAPFAKAPPGWPASSVSLIGSLYEARGEPPLLRHQKQWNPKPSNLGLVAWRNGEQWIGIEQSTVGGTLTSFLFDEQGRKLSEQPIARFESPWIIPSPLLREEGGLWLADRDGWFLAVNDNMTRADPLGVFQHLRQRGTGYIDWNEWWYSWELIWLLVGLPLVVASILLARKLRGEALDATAYRSLVWGVGLFLVSEVFFLSQLLPIME